MDVRRNRTVQSRSSWLEFVSCLSVFFREQWKKSFSSGNCLLGWSGQVAVITLLSRSTLSLFTQSLTNSPTDLTAFLFRFVTHRDAITIYYVFSLYSVTLLLRATIGDWSSDSMCLCHVVNLNSTDGTHYAQFQLISTRLVVGASIRPLVNNHWELNSNFSVAPAWDVALHENEILSTIITEKLFGKFISVSSLHTLVDSKLCGWWWYADKSKSLSPVWRNIWRNSETNSTKSTLAPKN